jgi:5-methylcytosine-specific restriction protein A
MPWSAGNTKSIAPGDRLFLLKQGARPRGIIGAGWASSESYESTHWNADLASRGGTALFVDVEFDRILNPELDPPLAVDGDSTGPLADVYWAIPASGTQLPVDAARELETRWEDHLRNLRPGQSRVPSRNPPWQRDELILALDLYVQHGGRHLADDHPAVVDLSRVLNELPIHRGRRDGETYRNPNGVSMKLLNFRQFDPTQEGVGLTRGNRLEKAVWEQYASCPDLLHQVAEVIRQGYRLVEPGVAGDVEEETFPEGRILYRLHRLRERNTGVIQKAKDQAKRRHGRLVCCVCTFEFAQRYGSLGEDYIEGHHTKPLSELAAEAETKVKDIALVCSNCHRMIHRRRPWLSLDELTNILRPLDGDGR